MADVEDVHEKLDLSPEDLQRLQRLWDEGKASGPAEPFDIERTIAAARSSFAKSQTPPAMPPARPV